MSKSLDKDRTRRLRQAIELGPNCLHRLSADDTSKDRKMENVIRCICRNYMSVGLFAQHRRVKLDFFKL